MQPEDLSPLFLANEMIRMTRISALLPAVLFFWSGLSVAQSPWDRIELVGKTAKVILVQPRFSLTAHGIFPLQRPDERQVSPIDLHMGLTAPAVFESLFEQLGGEFFVGDLSGPTTQPYRLTGRIHPMPGWRAGFRMGKYWEWQTGINLFRATWSGAFPISIYPKNGDPPFMEEGHLTATTEGFITDLALVGFLTRSACQPFARMGVRWQISTDEQESARVRDIQIDRMISSKANTIWPSGSLGMRLIPATLILIDLSITYTLLPGKGPGWSAEISTGVRF